MIVATALQLNYFISALKSDDLTLALWGSETASQFVQCTSIATTSMLYIKQLIDRLESGFLRVDDVRRREGGEYGSSQNKDSKGYRGFKSSRGSKAMLSDVLRTNRSEAPESRAWAERGSASSAEQGPPDLRQSSDIDLPGWDQTSNSRMIVETRSWTIENHTH